MTKKFDPIAIIGLGSLMPGSRSVRKFWRDILGKKDYIKEVPQEYWSKEDYYDPNPKTPDKTYTYKGGFLDSIDFPAMEYGIPPKLLSDIDSSQLLSLMVTDQAIKDAFGDKLEGLDRSDICVTIGTTGGQKLFCEASGRLELPKVRNALEGAGIRDKEVIQKVLEKYSEQFVPWTENTFPGLLGNVVAGRIANRFDFGGENCVIDAACASALGAIRLSIHNLQTGHAKVAVCGGVDTANGIPMYVCFSKTPALSPTHDCRPLSQDADGTMLGEGIGLLVLKRLEEAEKDGDDIYAVIRGYGVSSDGRAKSIYAPSEEGQKRALKRCYASAGYDPSTVELIEMHGTGTKVGDRVEINALNEFFNTDQKKNYCALGSVKSQYGHTKGAAGAVSLMKVVMALNNKVLPPTIKVDNPVDVSDTAFYISADSRPWFKKNEMPRRASVSSFGFGGANYHLTLEEYTGKNKKAKTAPFPKVVPFGAETKNGLDEKVKEFEQELNDAYIWDDFVEHKAQAMQKDFDSSSAYKQIFVLSKTGKMIFKGEELAAGPLVFKIDTFKNSMPLLTGKELVETFDYFRESLEKHLHITSLLYPNPWFSEEEKTVLQQKLDQGSKDASNLLINTLVGLLKRFNIEPDHFICDASNIQLPSEKLIKEVPANASLISLNNW